MKQHFCPAEQSMIAFEKECNWCGEREGSMTQDELFELANQAGFYISPIDSVLLPKLEAFAKLVAAKEREACAKVCQDGLNIATCLNALDDMEMWGEKFAKAIRARGQA